MSARYKLPATVLLPACETITAQHLAICLATETGEKPSRALLSWWRKSRNWPNSVKVANTAVSNVSEIAAYLTSRGVLVKRI